MPAVYEGGQDATGLRFAIVVSRYNNFVTGRLLDGALSTLSARGAADESVDVYWVPGAFEIPVITRTVARSGRYDAVLCLGAVIRGETDHAALVAREAARGIGRVALDTGIPCIFEVLSTPNVELAMARAGGDAGNKGNDAAEAAIEIAQILRSARSALES